MNLRIYHHVGMPGVEEEERNPSTARTPEESLRELQRSSERLSTNFPGRYGREMRWG
jgi:hypothetical protein